MHSLNGSGLKISREKKGLTVSELSTMLKVDVALIRGWEAGAGIIPLNKLIEISKLLETSIEMILFNEDRESLSLEGLTDSQILILFELYKELKKNQ